MIQTDTTRHRYIGVVSSLRFPVKFSGTNLFHSNHGGGLNINHARITINGRMEFLDNHGAALGGAIRFGELVLVSLNKQCFSCVVYVKGYILFIYRQSAQLVCPVIIRTDEQSGPALG